MPRALVMGTELMSMCVQEDNDDVLSVPPGFETFAAYTLKRVNDGDKMESYSPAASSSASHSVPLEIESEVGDGAKVMRSLRPRSGINYGLLDDVLGNENNPRFTNPATSNSGLPKGVIRGCSSCINCQKVTARWRPELGCRPVLDDAPVFYPTEEEFRDTLKYLASIRTKAEPFGICRIVPPPSWKPPCLLKEKPIWDSSKFSTRVQRVDKLQKRDSLRKVSKQPTSGRKKRRRCVPEHTNGGVCLENFGFEPGPDFTLHTFEKYANNFKSQYFGRIDACSNEGGGITSDRVNKEPSVEDIEGEYWRIVEKPTEEIEVLYGADLETGSFGSGFPKASSSVTCAELDKYSKSGWNLNNFPRLPGSILSFESGDISGVLVPWLYIGMCFSSFCWHVEDHHLYSLNYMHWGSPKLWYGVSGRDAASFENVMKRNLADLFEEQPDLLHKLVTQFSPSSLKSEGVPVYRCVQNPGEFVLTFPRAYHSGFNCGFNCAEAVNVAPVDWLLHGHVAVELYSEQKRRTSISHDKLLLGAAREAAKAHYVESNLLRKNIIGNNRWISVCGKDGILTIALKQRVEIERLRREAFCSSHQIVKMDSNFDATSERECIICLFDLHLSAAGCSCSPDKYACLRHSKHLCSCVWGTKYFLFRYEINELDILVEALEGNMGAIYRWANLDLQKASSTTKDNLQLSNASSPNGNDSKLKPHVLKLRSPNNGAKSGWKHLQTAEKAGQIGISSCQDTACAEDANSIKYLHVPTLASDNNSKCDSETKQSVLKLKDMSRKHLENNASHVKYVTPYIQSTLHTSKDANCMPVEVKVEYVPSSDLHFNVTNMAQSYSTNTAYLGKMLHTRKPDTFISGPVQVEIGCYQSEKKLHEALNTKMEASCSQPLRCEKIDENVGSAAEIPRVLSGSQSSSPNNQDLSCRQKGPRIAKMVRRINCSVEPLEFGFVISGKLWSNNRAIFPKGFKSRVKYISLLDPTTTCYYVSEIVDGGQKGPLFMVSLESCQTDVFIHISPTKSWEMVRERVNHEISKHHKMGKSYLHPLQPPGSLDGFEMFGFLSPNIVQVIESLDRQRVSAAYWDTRPYSRPPSHNPQLFPMNESEKNAIFQEEASETMRDILPLRRLLKKATYEELYSVRKLFDNINAEDRSLVSQVFMAEISNHKKIGNFV